MSGHHVFCCWFTKLDLADWILEGGQLLAWTAGLTVLAKRCLTELDVLAVWVTVDIDVGDAHCDG